MSFFEKMFASKAEREEDKTPEKKAEAPKKNLGPYRESEIKDADEFKRLREELERSGKYDMIDDFKEGVTWARNRKTKKVVLINKAGEEISEKFDTIGEFYDGIAKVEKRNKQGFFETSFINRSGKLIADKQFDGGYSFSDGFAAVKKDGKWFFVDKDLEKVIGDFEDGYGFSKPGFKKSHGKIEGGAWVKKDGKWSVIDKDGNELPIKEDNKKNYKD